MNLKKNVVYVVLFIILLLGLIYSKLVFPVKCEVLYQKEYEPKGIGNCRIKNTQYAKDKEYYIYALWRHNKKGEEDHHVVAVDSKGMIYDVSNGKKSIAKTNIEDYKKLNRAKLEYILKSDGTIIKGSIFNPRLLYTELFLFFSRYYKIKVYKQATGSKYQNHKAI